MHCYITSILRIFDHNRRGCIKDSEPPLILWGTHNHSYMYKELYVVWMKLCFFIVITKSIHWNQKNSGWRNCIEFRNASDPLTKKKSFLLEFNQTWYKANVTIKQIRILNVRCCNVPNVVKSAQLKAVPTE